MHFTVLYLMKGKMKNITERKIENSFGKRYCDGCGEQEPTCMYVCDWFMIGGRWNDTEILPTKIGKSGRNGVGENYREPKVQVCEIKDLTGPINTEFLYALADESGTYYESTEPEFNEVIEEINSKKIKGVVAVIDCHD